MGITLHVRTEAWRTHLAATVQKFPGIIPVVKGNGYGFGRELALAEATALGCDTIAVGTYTEAAEALESFAGDVLVLTPWRPGDDLAHERLIHTVSRLDDLGSLPSGARHYVEGATSLTRHGIAPADLPATDALSIHLPLAGHADNLAQAVEWATRLGAGTLTVSHLSAAEVAELRQSHPHLTIRPRVGTALWLGDLSALSVTATVLDIHPVRRGQRVGYRQRPVRRTGHLVVIGAGTSHGVGLDAPKASLSVANRGKSVARGGLEAAGWSRSPFVIDGRQRWFVEPPHMHHSMVLLPAGATVPAVGDEVTAQVRFTTTAFDTVSFE